MRLPNIPDEFWHQRAALKTIRHEAHRRGAGADAVLSSVLVLVAGNMPHRVTIDTGVAVSLRPSLYTVLAGASGTGKSTGWGVARAMLPDLPDPVPLSTGEGLVEAYYGRVPVEEPQPPVRADDDKPRKPPKIVYERRQVRHNAVALIDEGEALFRQLERPGNIVGATLRSMWSGAVAGQQNADPERTRTLAAGSYNLGLAVGLQPDISARLLADTGTGMAQRFMWTAATDVHLSDDVPGFLRAAPISPLVWVPPALPGEPVDRIAAFMAQEAPPTEPVRMTLDQGISDRLFAEQVARSRGDVVVDERDSQRTAMLSKIAAVLTWLDGRLRIGVADWQLAEVLMSTSDQVRDALLEHAEEVTARERTERGIERAQVDLAKTQAETQRAKTRDRVLELLVDGLKHGGDGVARRDLTSSIGTARRPFLAEVLAEMAAKGEVREERAHSGGSRYTLVRGE